MINEVMKMNKRLKPLIIGFAAMMISGCSNPNAGNKPVSETVSMTALEISPTEIDIPQGVSGSATASAASLSRQGVYPVSTEVPSANAAAMMARCAKLLEQGIAGLSRHRVGLRV